MAGKLREVNIKQGMPTVEEARKLLIDELAIARRQGITAVKVIHGYGSSGVGGVLKAALRQWLLQRKREGRIKTFVAGEKWGIFDADSRRILDDCPDLAGDIDLNRHNAGITIVLL